MEVSSALRVAISLHLLPAQYSKIKNAPLPEGVDVLLLIALGDEKEIQKAIEKTRHPKETVRQAAIFFIEKVLLSHDSNSYRILGVNSDAPRDELRRNMALMTRYLHPDIADKTKSGLLTRVTSAWNDLKTEEKRKAYDVCNRQTFKKQSLKNQSRSQKHSKQRQRQRASSRQPNNVSSRQHFSYRRQWKGAILRQIMFFFMKIFGLSK